MKDILIIGYSNITKQGLTVHLNKRTRLKGLNIINDNFWVSWDKIGKALFENYCDDSSVQGRDRIREQALKEKGDNNG